jgi:hypothetical protein
MTLLALNLLTPWIVGIASLIALWLCAGIWLALWHDSQPRVELAPLVLVLTPDVPAKLPANATVVRLPAGATFGQPMARAAA